MYLIVEGGRKKERDRAEKIAAWVFKKLMPRHRAYSVTIHLRDILMKEGAYGWCFEADKRDFIVDVHKKIEEYESPAEYIKTFLHELVHVWQYTTGTCKFTNGGKCYWKGKDYTSAPYSKQPWERQAFRMQESLYEELAKECPDLV